MILEADVLGSLLSGERDELFALLLEERGIELADEPALRPRKAGVETPLSFAQERLWFLDQMAPGSTVNTIGVAVRLDGTLDREALAASLREIVRRHEALRTVFPQIGGQPVQRVLTVGAVTLHEIDLTTLAPARRSLTAARLHAEEGELALPLGDVPPLRLLLVRLGPAEHVLRLTAHHLICDGWSLGVITQELTQLYAGFRLRHPAALPGPVLQYPDFAVWEREWLRGERLEELVSYWRQRLVRMPPVLELPADRPRPAVQSNRIARRLTTIPAAGLGPLREVARLRGCTPFAAYLAVFDALLWRNTGQSDLAVGTPVANRCRSELEGVVGLFANTLVLRVRVAEEPTFLDLLGPAADATLGALAHQTLPFALLVRELQPARSLSRSPLVQVLLSLQNAPVELPALGDLRLVRLNSSPAASSFDVTLEIEESEAGLVCALDYSVDLFDATTAARLLGEFEILLGELVAAPERRVSELPLLGGAGRAQLLREWNDTAMELPSQPLLHRLFAAQAARSPEAIALVCDDRALTYRELDDESSRVARQLRRLGAGPESIVGVCLRRSARIVVSLLGVLKAGAAYLPIDPSLPAERIAFMLEDSGAQLVLGERATCAELPIGARLVLIDSDELADGEEEKGTLEDGADPESLAYTIYTSGSTGRPKGVQVTHRSLINFLAAMPALVPADGLLAVTTISFDIAGLELYQPLLAGARIVLASAATASDPERLRAALIEHEVTVMQATPATWRMLVESGWEGEPRLTALCGGEALSRDLAELLLRRCAAVWNLYGPTETTIWSAIERVAFGKGPVPLGRPLANTRLHVLDRGQRPVSIGVLGELCIAGDGLARGYCGGPSLTAERFLPDALGERPGSRLYRTGDLARYRPDGCLEFLGRLDQQVKLRGFRIELEEIEAALRRHAGVREAAVVLAAGPAQAPEERRLVAYWVPHPDGQAVTGELRDGLRRQLPEYMVPAVYVRLEAMPLTHNGKLDRRSLPAVGDGVGAGGAAEPPRSLAEEMVAGIWCEVLDRPQVGAHERFFDLGGHSLLATRVASRLRQAFSVEVPLRWLFELPTVAALAARLEDTRRAVAPMMPPVVPIPRDREMSLSFAQQRIWFFEQTEPGSAAFVQSMAIRFAGRLDVAALERSLNQLVRRHEALRARFLNREGIPALSILPEASVLVPCIDLTQVGEAAAHRLAGDEARRPIDIAKGPLLRATLLVMGGADQVLLMTIHHIVSDAWSIAVLADDLAFFYNTAVAGRPGEREPLPVQYADYALWQRRWLTGEVLDMQLAFWRQRLAGAPLSLDLPYDRPRRADGSNRGGRRHRILPPERLADVLRFARGQGASLSMVLLAAWSALLLRLTRQDDFVVATPVANRGRQEIERIIGLFVNTLVLRLDLKGDPDGEELLGRTRDLLLDAADHQDLPFERLVEELQPPRLAGRAPLYEVMFGVQNAAADLSPMVLQGLRASPFAPAPEPGAQVDTLNLFSHENEHGLLVTLSYNAELFDAESIERLLGHFSTLLAGMVSGPGQRVGELALLSAAERQQVVVAWNEAGLGGGWDSAQGRSQDGLHERFAAQAARTPEAVAVVGPGGERLTYRELDGRSSRLAHYLGGLGVGPEVLVAVAMRRSPSLVVALLGILKAGGAYVPLDPSYPAERLAFIVEDTAAPVLLSERELLSRLPVSRARVVCLDAEGPEGAAIAAEPAAAPRVAGSVAGRLAYVIYTSGSTGRPKGVSIEHRSAVALLDWAAGVFSAAELSGVLASTSICFDLSVFELFLPLAVGGKVIVAENALALPEHAAAGEVTLVNTVPSAMAELLRLRGLPESVRTVNLAGEVLKRSLAEEILAQPQGLRLFNLYGPSEDTTYSTVGWIGREPGAPSIGRPIDGTRLYLLGQGLEPVPVGVTGELYLAGAGLARGYLGRPAATAERFVPDPFSPWPGGRLYRTGDVARYRADGEVDFLGRCDHQVKIRGFRIELGEVESVLERHPGVRESVAVALSVETGGDQRLVAYVGVGERGGPGADELREFLSERLPGYMVPSLFVELASLPRTPNGKVDRRALPAPEKGARKTALVTPESAVERTLAKIWQEVLGIEQVGLNDHFLSLGGDSIQAIQVVARARQAGIPLAHGSLFRHPTLAALAAAAAAAPQAPPAPPERAAVLLTDCERRLLAERPEIEDVYALAPLQQGMLHDVLTAPKPGLYLVQQSYLMAGGLDFELFARACRRVVERHSALRTAFVWDEGSEPLQLVFRAVALDLGQRDLSGLGAAEQEETTQALLREERLSAPFDLSSPPLLRLTLLRLAEERTLLLWRYHHLILDGWSVTLLLREALLFYDVFRRGADLRPKRPRPYRDFLVWQAAQDRGAAEAYWRGYLLGVRGATPLGLEPPAISIKAAASSPGYGCLRRGLPPADVQALRRLAREQRLTPSVFVQGAWALLLAHYSGERDVLFGAAVSGRSPELAGSSEMVGLLLNTVPVRVAIDFDEPVVPWLERLHARQIASLPYEWTPLVDVQRWSGIAPGGPLLETLVVYQNHPTVMDARTGETGLSVRPLHSFDRTSFPLTLVVEPAPGLVLEALYVEELFDAESIERLLGHFSTLLAGMVSGPGQRVGELALLSAAERQQVVVAWNEAGLGGGWDSAQGRSQDGLHERFAAQAARTPEAVAVVGPGGERLTYRELDGRSSRLAHYLGGLGVGPEVLVAVAMRRSPSLVVALLGILKAGGAYVPLDPSYPAERLAFIVEDTAAPVLLSERELLSRLPVSRARVVCLDAEGPEGAAIAAEPAAAPRVAGSVAGRLAYVIYTSGSTGRPKGVSIEHRSAVALLDWAAGVFSAAELSGVLASTSICFDLSVFELFLPLAVGGKVIVAENALALPEHAAAGEVTLVNTVPSAMAELLRLRGLPESVRTVNLAGEVLKRSLAEEILAQPQGLRLFNLYGPSEDTTYSTVGWIGREPGAPSIGRPIDGTRLYLLGQGLEPVPVGVTGELYLAGAGLARGYLGRPAATAERFVPDPFSPWPGGRLYRTGDVARYRADGEVDFLGRCDHQVKIRGFRIELGEVESVLERHPGVRESVAVALSVETGGDQRLVAYVGVGERGGPGADELREFLSERLPGYMVPSLFVELASLPRTPNGKVDRRALPAPEKGARKTALVTPESAVERTLAKIWQEVLGIEQVGLNDHFLSLGGDSIQAIQVVARARQAGIPLAHGSLFRHPTLAALAASAPAMLPPPQKPPGQAIARSDSASRLLAERPEIEDAYALAPLQQGMLFHTLKQPEGLHFRSQICFRLDGHLDPEIFQQAWETAAVRHPALRTAFLWEAIDQPLQVVFRQVELPFERLDLRHLTAEERERRVEAIWQADREQGFELTRAPLMRFRLIRTGETEHRLLWTYHHLLLDGWSLGILTDEVLALYEARGRGEEAALPVPGLYRDFIAHLQQQDLAPAEQFWRAQLAGFSGATPLGIDRIDHAPKAGERFDDPHGTQELRLTATTTATLKSFARGQELTLNVLMQGIWALLLSHYSGRREVLFAMAVSGRPAELAGVESTVGLFINTLPVRVDVPPQARFLPWLRELQQRHSAILQHQLTPPLLLRQWAGVAAGMRFYESFLVFQNYPVARAPLHGRTLDLMIESTRGATETPLSLVIDPAAELSLRINYDRGRLCDDTVARTLGHLRTMLASVAADPEQALSAIPFLTEAERRELLAPSAAAILEPPELDLDQMSDEDVERMLEQLLAAEPKET